VTAPTTLATLRDYVARLKGENAARVRRDAQDNQQAVPVRILTIAALHEVSHRISA